MQRRNWSHRLNLHTRNWSVRPTLSVIVHGTKQHAFRKSAGADKRSFIAPINIYTIHPAPLPWDRGSPVQWPKSISTKRIILRSCVSTCISTKRIILHSCVSIHIPTKRIILRLCVSACIQTERSFALRMAVYNLQECDVSALHVHTGRTRSTRAVILWWTSAVHKQNSVSVREQAQL